MKRLRDSFRLGIVLALVAVVAVPVSAAAPGSVQSEGEATAARLSLPSLDLAASAASTLAAAEAAALPLAGAVDGALGALAGAVDAAARLAAHAVDLLARALAGAVQFIGSLVASAAAAAASTAAAVAGALAALAGDAARAAARVPPRDAALVAGGAGAGLSLAAALNALRKVGWLSALPLYSRLMDRDILRHEGRAAIHRYVGAHPGAHTTQIADALGLGWGTAVYHLNLLESRKLVKARRAGNQRCYFAAGAVAPEAQAATVAVKNDRARGIAQYVRDHPGATQKDVARALGMSAALASWHVKRLTAANVLSVERIGKSHALTLAAGGREAAAAGAEPATLTA
ncbi:MAG TPA: winged helix-turn-helix transcriptional regulator [Candidatus Thermoplasmatota archaeon]|nr:winged helix-turn-helix transcriptional regulator [Candidatus Thermoplasmatota archaeon]